MKLEKIRRYWPERVKNSPKHDRDLGPGLESGDSLTLFGGFVFAYYHVTAHWESERTIEEYISYLDSVILPNIPGHDTKPITE